MEPDIVRTLASLLLLVLATTGAAAGEPFRAGYGELRVSDPVSGADILVAIWYPTAAAEGEVGRGPFLMRAAENAAPAPGKHPLVVVSHGSGGSHLGHRDTALHLARTGNVVAAPLHAHNNFRDDGGAGSWAVWTGRPKTVSAVIDRVLSDATLGPVVDGRRVGVVGFSAGGYTALALIGARPAMANFAKHCQAHPEDAVFCSFQPPADPDIGRPMNDLADPRIGAAVVMAPVATPFDDGAFREVTVPVRLYRAEKDQILAHPWHAERVRKLLPRPPEYVVVEGAGHYAFLAPVPEALREELAELAIDAPGFDREAMHARMNAQIADFFGRTLR